MFKTIIVDDEPHASDWLSIHLNEIPDVSILSVENNAEDALRSIKKLKPNLLFLDIEMPFYSGFELLRLVNKAGLHPIVIFTTAYKEYAIKAVKVMAYDYLIKPIDIDELRDCINKLQKSTSIIPRMNLPNLKLIEKLTPREEDVFLLIIEGNSSQEIADSLCIGKATVDSHRKNLLLKTQANNTVELVVWGVTKYFNS